MCAGCFSWCRLSRLRMPWSAKKESTMMPMELPEVSARLCYSLTHRLSCIQKLESKPAIVPATTLDVMEPKLDEVRWPVHLLRSL